MLATLPHLNQLTFPAMERRGVEILQLNLGYLCNLQCQHCHVNAGPKRTELMTRETIDQVLTYLEQSPITILDLTGGAPEMNPDFRYLVERARALGVRVIDRCNLTILEETGYEWLGEFIAEQAVEVVASMPCYLEENVDRQRGDGTFADNIVGLRRLNRLGYGQPGGLMLDLVFNPLGASLPPPQQELEVDYKRQLEERYGIQFNHLLTITNMPIKRFGSMLLSSGQFDDYMQLLVDAYQPQNLETVMCRTLLSVDWQGYLYDCDFNQMLEMPIERGDRRLHISDLGDDTLRGHPISVRDHCFGCTAGQGSSCSGAL